MISIFKQVLNSRIQKLSDFNETKDCVKLCFIVAVMVKEVLSFVNFFKYFLQCFILFIPILIRKYRNCMKSLYNIYLHPWGDLKLLVICPMAQSSCLIMLMISNMAELVITSSSTPVWMVVFTSSHIGFLKEISQILYNYGINMYICNNSVHLVKVIIC